MFLMKESYKTDSPVSVLFYGTGMTTSFVVMAPILVNMMAIARSNMPYGRIVSTGYYL